MTSARRDDEQLHELRDMLVEEVSLVDRAANKRRFVLVKRDGSLIMADAAELREKDDGTFEHESKADNKADEEKDEKSAKAKADAEKEDEDKKAAKAKADSEKEDEDDAAKAKKLSDAVIRAADMLASAGQEGADVAKLLKELTGVTDVEKAGARMSKDRYNRFKQAVDLLTSVFSEVSPPVEPGIKAKAKAAEEDEDEEMKGKKKSKTKKSDDSPELAETVEQLTDTVSTLTKALAASNAQVEKISKARGISHVMTPEGPPSTKVEKAVSWPVDMTRPMGRENVAKEKFWG